MKEDNHPTTLAEMFGSSYFVEDSEGSGKARFSLRKLFTVVGISVGIAATATGAIAASEIMKPAPHAERIGHALEEWTIQNPGMEVPEVNEYVSYSSYLSGLGPLGVEFGLPDFGNDTADILLKVKQPGKAGSPFFVCAYDSNGLTKFEALKQEYSFYSFESNTGVTRIDNPECA